MIGRAFESQQAINLNKGQLSSIRYNRKTTVIQLKCERENLKIKICHPENNRFNKFSL